MKISVVNNFKKNSYTYKQNETIYSSYAAGYIKHAASSYFANETMQMRAVKFIRIKE